MMYTIRKPLSNVERALKREFDAKIKRSNNCNFPATDVFEADNKLNVLVEMPGLAKQDISLNVNDENILTINGNKDENKLYEGKTLLRRERRECSYVRYIALPEDIDKENIKAKYENGLLKLEIPKQEPKMPKNIEIGIN